MRAGLGEGVYLRCRGREYGSRANEALTSVPKPLLRETRMCQVNPTAIARRSLGQVR